MSNENPAGTSEARGAATAAAVPWTRPEPRPGEVDVLIEAARRHPLGLEFLDEGELGCVAVTFGVHAFTVDAARRRLGRGPA